MMVPDQSQSRAFAVKLDRSPILWASYPKPKFSTLSITGERCALNCKHCGGHYLKHMISCPTPTSFYETCLDLALSGKRGVLISGGYNEGGWVPLEGFLEAIESVKRETGLFLNVHTGLVPPKTARGLGEAGVDMVSFDMIGSDETVEYVLGIKRKAKDYERTLRMLTREIPHVAAHICVGLHEGRLKGERKALSMVEDVDTSALVFLVLIPTPSTPFEKAQPPSPTEVGELIAEARLKFPDIPLALGCMRPRDDSRVETELQAIGAGIDRIVLPSAEAVRAARKMGLEVRQLRACCSVPNDVAEAWSHG
ncbi:MAG: radical SAM protein [Candidatus Hadarchaeota archaeon]|nr:radical SAM protein [Candidatus Hadarchaeota archaeon]